MLISIQALRAFAAWVVVLHHFMQVSFDFRISNPLELLLVTRAQMGVDIFFVLSGFVIYITTAGRSVDTGQFLWRRAARIVPVYWFYTAVTAAILYFAGDIMPIYGLDLPSLLASLFFVPHENPAGFGDYPVLPVGWTLNFEMMFYVLFALCLLLPERWRLWSLVGAIALLNLLLARYAPVSDFYKNPIIYEFLLGVGVGVLYRRGFLAPTRHRWLWGVAGTACFAFMLGFDDQSPWRLLVWGLPAGFLVIALIRLEPLFSRYQSLRRMGDRSYSVYLVHIIVLWLSEALFHQKLGWSPWVSLMLSVLAIAALSKASFELIEKRLTRHLAPARARPAPA